MKEDRKLYKDFQRLYNLTFMSFYLLKIIVLDERFYGLITSTHEKILGSLYSSLEKTNLIRKIGDDYIPTAQGRKVFVNANHVDDVISHFNELKRTILKINRIANCNAEKSAINARIKEYGVEDVKAVISLKFKEWENDKDMRQYLTNMSTLMKFQGFEGWVAKIDLVPQVINKTRNLDLG